MSLKRSIGLLALILSTTVWAQVVDESLESGGLSAAWALTTKSGMTLEGSTLAAHRGRYGLRLVDAEDAVDAQPGAFFSRTIDVPAPTLFTRLWLRKVSSNRLGGASIWLALERKGSASVEGTAFAWAFDGDGRLSGIEQGLFANGTIDYSTQAFDSHLDGGWQLLEAAVLGLGDKATVRYAVDGQMVFERRNVTAAADRFSSVRVGETYANGPGFRCTLDFDDLRVDPMPMGSRLELDLESPISQAQCAALEVKLMPTFSLDGGAVVAVAAPYALQLRVEGLGVLFSDSRCAALVSPPSLAKGQSQQTFYFHAPDAGLIRATVEHDELPSGDFIPGSATATVLPPGSGSQSYYAVHCQGCASGPESAGFFAVVVLLAQRARRSKRRAG